MKWFKHLSTARNDERLSRLEDKCGLEGYGFYFKMLEIVAENIDSTNKCSVTYSMSRWGRHVNVTTKKFLFLSQCCADVGLMTVQRGSDDGLTIDRRGADDITVNIPNLLNYRDNHTKNLQATCKQDKETYKEDKEKEVDKDNLAKAKLKASVKQPEKENTIRAGKNVGGVVTSKNGFDSFWSEYPKKKGRGDAEKAWNKINPDEQLRKVIIDAVVLAKTQDFDWGKNNGEFIPYPSTYLNGKRWMDEISQKNHSQQKSKFQQIDYGEFPEELFGMSTGYKREKENFIEGEVL